MRWQLGGLGVALLLLLNGCIGQTAPYRQTQDHRAAQTTTACQATDGQTAGDLVAYLNRPITQISIFPRSGGINDGADVAEADSIKQIQSALYGAAVVDSSEMRGLEPDVSLILWTESPRAKWGVEWASGTQFVRLGHDGKQGISVTLKVKYECLSAIAQVVNAALARDCPASAVAYPFHDVAMGRHVPPILAVDGGGIWRAGQILKVLWRIQGAGGDTTPTITFTRSDGVTGGEIRVSGPVGSPGQPPDVQDYPSNLTIPQPGCWTIAVKAGLVTRSVVVRVR